MTRTKITRTLALTGLVPAGKLSNLYSGLLPVLALCAAGVAWSQPVHGARGARVPPDRPGGSQPAKPAASSPASAEYRFITIETPNAISCGLNYYCNAPFGINNARFVTGEYTDSSNAIHGFAWHNGVLRTLDYAGATNTGIFFVNNRGVVAGYYTNAANDGYRRHVFFPGRCLDHASEHSGLSHQLCVRHQWRGRCRRRSIRREFVGILDLGPGQPVVLLPRCTRIGTEQHERGPSTIKGRWWAGTRIRAA
jgi:hypothetical protein